MIGAQSDSIGMGVRGLDPAAGDESEDPMILTSQEVGSVFGFKADECATSVAGSIPPSSDGAICSGLIPGAATGAIPRIMCDGRSKSCSSRLFGVPDMGSNPSKIKSPRISAV